MIRSTIQSVALTFLPWNDPDPRIHECITLVCEQLPLRDEQAAP